MKTLKSFPLLALILFFNYQFSSGQAVEELPFKPLNKDYVELTKALDEINETDDQKSIEMCLNALEKFDDPNIRYTLMFWELSFHYSKLKEYDKCLGILKKGQEEGFYYYLTDSERRTFPSYLKDLKALERYVAFMAKNEELKDKESETVKTEFMVQLPEGFQEGKKYPLFLALHGGIGSIADLQYYYDSPKLKAEYIRAYFQGGSTVGSFTRRFSRENWQERIPEGFNQIVAKYPVDTSNVILGGPSAGGYGSIVFGMNNIIRSKGLLLSFAVAPRDMDSTVFIQSAQRGLKIALLCGENDWAIKQQKELGYKFDKYGITNRFVVFPETGHEFPENWSHHLNTSIEFIMKEN